MIAYESASLYAEVPGYLKKQNVDIGQMVTKDQVLAVIAVPELDAQVRRCSAALDQANATVAEQIANAARAARDVERDKPLAEARAIPRSQLETDIEIQRAAEAAVTAARALPVGEARYATVITARSLGTLSVGSVFS